MCVRLSVCLSVCLQLLAGDDHAKDSPAPAQAHSGGNIKLSLIFMATMNLSSVSTWGSHAPEPPPSPPSAKHSLLIAPCQAWTLHLLTDPS